MSVHIKVNINQLKNDIPNFQKFMLELLEYRNDYKRLHGVDGRYLTFDGTWGLSSQQMVFDRANGLSSDNRPDLSLEDDDFWKQITMVSNPADWSGKNKSLVDGCLKIRRYCDIGNSITVDLVPDDIEEEETVEHEKIITKSITDYAIDHNKFLAALEKCFPNYKPSGSPRKFSAIKGIVIECDSIYLVEELPTDILTSGDKDSRPVFDATGWVIADSDNAYNQPIYDGVPYREVKKALYHIFKIEPKNAGIIIALKDEYLPKELAKKPEDDPNSLSYRIKNNLDQIDVVVAHLKKKNDALQADIDKNNEEINRLTFIKDKLGC